ncbi:MAG: 50S ribosomal protein L30 [Acidobacteria bacterium]|nr:50S ribosomal protein L30 [Acidobacteriota bacterium]
MSRKKKPKISGATVRIQYVRSSIGFSRSQKETVRGLGLSRLQQVVERPDTPQIRGMVRKVPHLVAILESEA